MKQMINMALRERDGDRETVRERERKREAEREIRHKSVMVAT